MAPSRQMSHNPVSMKLLICIAAALLLVTGCVSKKGETAKRGGSIVLSPDQKLAALVTVTDGQVSYAVRREGLIMLEGSKLGLQREDADFSKDLKLLSVDNNTVRDEYTLLHGKRKNMVYEASRAVLHLENGTGQKMDIIFQVSNDGVAFRYHFPETSTDKKKVHWELSSFNFSDSARAWIQPRARAKSGWNQSNPSYEENYLMDMPVRQLAASDTGWVFPSLFRVGKYWMLLSETAPDRDYCASRLLKGDRAGELVIGFPEASEHFPGGPVYPESPLPWTTPWRIIAIGSLKTVMESTLGTDLAKPSTLTDIAFVKPGRASWSWVSLKDDSIVYDVQKRFIDYAAIMKWEYCLIDVNWDTKIGYDKIKELTAYAAGKGVGIILWYNSAGDWNTVPYHPRSLLLTKESREAEFKRISAMGIKGIKVDFFGGDGQAVISYYQDIIEDAARYKLVVNCHGSTLPRGFQRTYPNLVSMEAVKGFEFVTFAQENADRQPAHCATLPFTRNVFDPMDFTPVCFSEVPNIRRKTSNAFELALAVLFQSGVQHYAEKPAGMQSVPDYVRQLMTEIPVSWDNTEFIDGYPGKFVILKREVNGVVYVAGINGEPEDRTLELSLSAMPKRKGIYVTDGVDNRSFRKEAIDPTQTDRLKVTLKGNGGFVMVF